MHDFSRVCFLLLSALRGDAAKPHRGEEDSKLAERISLDLPSRLTALTARVGTNSAERAAAR